MNVRGKSRFAQKNQLFVGAPLAGAHFRARRCRAHTKDGQGRAQPLQICGRFVNRPYDWAGASPAPTT